MIKNTIAIFGVPRSGTSWTGQIFNSSSYVAYRYQPLFSYEFKGMINANSNKQDIEKFHKVILNSKSDFVLQNVIISGEKGISFSKKEPLHLVWKEVRYLEVIEALLKNSTTKILLMVRHPCAVVNSWMGIPKEFDSTWDPIEEWRYAEKKNQGKKENYFGYEKWKEAAELFVNLKKKYPQRVMIVKYEDLTHDTPNVARKMFEYSGIPFEKQTENFILKSTSTVDDKDPYGVFRLNQDTEKWQHELDELIQEELLRDFEKSDLKDKLGY